MLKNYFPIALRNLARQRSTAFINILGLALGLACCLLLLLYIRHELSYDRFHEDAEALVRVNLYMEQLDAQIAVSPNIVAPLLMREFPEVEAAVRLEAGGGVVRVGETVLDDNRFYHADSSFFQVFNGHKLLAGDPATALVRPLTVVLTESTVARFFGADAQPDDVLGETILRGSDQVFEITGVMADVPDNAHYRFDFLASFATRTRWATEEIWGSANFFTYARLTSPTAISTLQAKIDAHLAELEAAGERTRTLALQPVTDIHLASDVAYDLDATGDWATVNGFGIVAALILLIACINYMNLATARSARRAKEVGLRKSFGAMREQLIGQFYGESALLAGAGLVGAVLLVALSLPAFNTLADKAFTFGDLAAAPVLALIGGVFLVVTLVAGSYPALYLSRPDPASVLRGTHGGGSGIGVGAAWLRKGLVVVQFGISALLIVGTLVVVSQLRYLGDQHLGFAKEQVVTMPISDPVLRDSYEAMAQAFEQHAGVVETAGINQVPGRLGWASGFLPEGRLDDEENWILIKGLPAEPRVVETLGLTMAAGRPFADDPPQPDSGSYQFLLNETAVAKAGWTVEDAVGRTMRVDSRHGTVLGVVEDFHYRSLHEAIEPLAIWYDTSNIMNLAVRLAPGDTRAAMDHMEAVWDEFAAHRPFAFTFVDDVYDRLYRNEERLAQIVSVFAVLAIVIACLGLFGLASFTAEQRRREVGIRKVLGASVSGLVGLLTRDFVVLVALAFALAVPAALWLLRGWLDGFAYRVGLGPTPFLLAAGLLLAIALVTVGTQALRAATADPVKALRHD